MVQYTIRVEGLDKLLEALKRAPGVVTRHLRRAMEQAVSTIQQQAQVYPPPPPNSSYTRTGTLGRRWSSRVEEMTGGVRGILDNPTPYAPYVQGDEEQAWMHMGRWRPIGKIVEEKEKELTKFFEAAIGEAVKEIAHE